MSKKAKLELVNNTNQVHSCVLKYYHGTRYNSATNILNKINVQCGRGELGQGFYVGSSLWRAYSWAWHKAKGDNYAVVEFFIKISTLFNLKIIILDRKEGRKVWKSWKSAPKPHLLEYDVCVSPLLGGHIYDTIQMKFESKNAEEYINNTRKKLLT